jgi:hypothetical protein
MTVQLKGRKATSSITGIITPTRGYLLYSTIPREAILISILVSQFTRLELGSSTIPKMVIASTVTLLIHAQVRAFKFQGNY